MGRLAKVLIMLIVAGFLCALLTAGALLLISGGNPVDYVQNLLLQISLSGRQAELNASIGTDDTPRRFTVNLGDSPRTIAANLFNAGLISDAELFVDYVQMSDLDVQLEAGTYFLNQTQSLIEIAQALTDSRNSQIVFTIIPGWRAEEVAAAIDANPLFGFDGAEFLQAIAPNATSVPIEFATYAGLPVGASLEGFLTPDTYQLPPDITAVELRDQLLYAFMQRLGPEAQAAAAAQNLTLYEVVVLASIVQRESVRPDENPMIASVYRNRLAIGMKLDADPTVQYAIGFENGTWWPQITQADYSGVISPYNTYLNIGLPPGPIANPSLSAIEATLNPTPTEYFFFRAACDGSGYHTFARTFDEHLANGCS